MLTLCVRKQNKKSVLFGWINNAEVMDVTLGQGAKSTVACERDPDGVLAGIKEDSAETSKRVRDEA